MRISRIHVDSTLALGASLVLEPEAAHYIGRVLRLPTGAQVSLFNGRDGEFLGTLTEVSKKQVQVELHEAVNCYSDPKLAIHLGVGLSRGERMDFLIQKATELGVSSITPLFTERCEVRLNDDRAGKRQQHWQRVAISACEQSTRCSVPEIALPVALGEWLGLNHTQNQGNCCFVLDHRQQAGFPRALEPTAVTLLSGPEGGLSEVEIDLAISQHGFQPVRLGPRVLRTETAPLAALSIVQALWGDF